jgi:hypothetical protein
MIGLYKITGIQLSKFRGQISLVPIGGNYGKN